MTPLLTYTLVTHVLTGVIAVGLITLVFMHLLKKTPGWKYLSLLSGSATVLFLISWVTSAYYYVTYYGAKVKPIILKGAYPWAHQIMMESKEHIFIILPFLTLTLYLATKLLGKIQDERIHQALRKLTMVAVILGVYITVSGMAISGAVR
ncbi:MAG: hypothetical protein AAB513_03730 [Patescibacteria group bacterium]